MSYEVQLNLQSFSYHCSVWLNPALNIFKLKHVSSHKVCKPGSHHAHLTDSCNFPVNQQIRQWMHCTQSLWLTLTIHGHFVNLCTVILFNISQDSDIIGLDKVNCNTLATKPTWSTNPKTTSLRQEQFLESNAFSWTQRKPWHIWTCFLHSCTSHQSKLSGETQESLQKEENREQQSFFWQRHQSFHYKFLTQHHKEGATNHVIPLHHLKLG